MLVGNGVEILKETISEYEINTPIILIPTFEVDDDLFYQSFIKSFYMNLFQRKSIEDCYKIAMKKIEEEK